MGEGERENRQSHKQLMVINVVSTAIAAFRVLIGDGGRRVTL